MINQSLYQRLEYLFKSVIVEDKDTAPKLIPNKGIDKELRPWKFAESYRGETYRVPCPICGDKKHHLYISSLSYSIPVIEGIKYPKIGLIAHCFRRRCTDDIEARKYLDNLINSDQITLDLTVMPEIDFEESESEVSTGLSIADFKSWQPDYHTFDETTPKEVLDYVTERGITKEDIKRLYIGWGKCWNEKKKSFIGNENWIQFPIFDQMGLRGFQSRVMHDSKMKYFFDYRTPKKMCLYNRLEASRHRIVSICEGVIDSIHIGKSAMAFFGYEPSEAQKRLIQQDGAQMVLYFPDQKLSPGLNPVEVADKVIAEWKTKYNFPWGIYRIDVPGDDAGEVPYDKIWIAAYEQLNKKNIAPTIMEALEREIIENRKI